MSSRYTWSQVPRNLSRRFTTLEGLREIGTGVYIAGAGGARVFSVRHQFDPEQYEDERTPWTAPARTDVESLSLKSWKGISKNQNGTGNLPHDSRALGMLEGEDGVKGDALHVAAMQAMMDEKRKTIIEEMQKEKPYHVFDKRKKWGVVVMIGVAGLFSGLSSNIYLPSLDAIAKDLNVSLNAVSLTITSYLIIQGISPLFWGSLSDTIGRRPIYIYSFLVYIVSNIALSFSPNFAVLLIFRGLQAAGSASTVSIGNGVIQDITPPAERGGFISFYQAIRNFSIAIGPVLGGLLANFFGFRSIFIFLLIISSLTLGAIVVFLPETLRRIAGNGSLRLTGIHKSLLQRFTKEPSYIEDRDDTYTPPKVTSKTFIEPLLLLREKDILLSLIFGGVIYAIWSMVTASTTGLFKQAFHLNEVFLGLAFIPNGLGTIVGSTIIGNLLNKSYKQVEETYKQTHGIPATQSFPKKALPADFPLEHARLAYITPTTVLFILSTALYGFSLTPSLTSKPGWIALPLVLQFFIAATSNAVFAVNQTLVSDLCPGKGASSTALNNLVRCSMGAVGVAFVEQMIVGVGVQATFLGLALVVVVVSPCVVVQWYWGMGWRGERGARKERKELAKGKGMGGKV